jgi:hypothetical protein
VFLLQEMIPALSQNVAQLSHTCARTHQTHTHAHTGREREFCRSHVLNNDFSLCLLAEWRTHVGSSQACFSAMSSRRWLTSRICFFGGDWLLYANSLEEAFLHRRSYANVGSVIILFIYSLRKVHIPPQIFFKKNCQSSPRLAKRQKWF